MKQFNLQEFQKNPSRKVVTRDGRPVRILCTDAVGEYPIVAIVKNENKEIADNFTKDGRLYKDSKDDRDLFFAPEKKEGYINLFKQTTGLNTGFVFNTKEEAEKSAKCIPNYITTVKIEWEE